MRPIHGPGPDPDPDPDPNQVKRKYELEHMRLEIMTKLGHRPALHFGSDGEQMLREMVPTGQFLDKSKKVYF